MTVSPLGNVCACLPVSQDLSFSVALFCFLFLLDLDFAVCVF